MKSKLLLTGDTSCFAKEFIRKASICSDFPVDVLVGTKDGVAVGSTNIECVKFNFYNPSTYENALEGVDKLVIVRPPSLKSFKRYIFPLVDMAKEKGINHILFLSTTDIDQKRTLAHHKIENYIQASGVKYTFLRCGFFMQNLERYHAIDIKTHRALLAPAGDGRISFIDVRDVVEVTFEILNSNEKYYDSRVELTGPESHSMSDVARIMSEILEVEVSYRDLSLVRFIREKKKEHTPIPLIFTMTVFYQLVKYGKEEKLYHDIENVLGRKGNSLLKYLEDFKSCFV